MSIHEDYEPIEPVSGVAGFVIALLCVMILLDTVAALGGVAQVAGLGAFNGGQADPELSELGLGIRGLSALAQLGVMLALVPLFCVWVYRCAVNARRLGGGGFTQSPGWAVGWYFVPVAMLWMPFRAMSEIWRASVPGALAGGPLDWGDRRAGALLNAWWIAWILGNIVTNFASRKPFHTGELEEIGAWMSVAGGAIQATAGALCAAVVGMLTARQTRSARQAEIAFESDGLGVA